MKAGTLAQLDIVSLYDVAGLDYEYTAVNLRSDLGNKITW